MKFVIKNAFGANLGTIPFVNIMNGSADIGDVVNSWSIFTAAGMAKFPQHPLSIFNTIAPQVVQACLASGSSFETQSSFGEDDGVEYDDVITFKGRDYYVVDYMPGDHARTEAILQILDKKVHDGRLAAETSDSAITANLDQLWAAIQGAWTSAPSAGISLTPTPVLAQPAPVIGTAGPARPQPPKVDAVAYSDQPSARTAEALQEAHVISTKAGDVDVVMAQQALSALLRKGSL